MTRRSDQDPGERAGADGLTRREALTRLGVGAAGLAGAGYGLSRLDPEAAIAGAAGTAERPPAAEAAAASEAAGGPTDTDLPSVGRVAGRPADLPAPVGRRGPRTHEVTLPVREVEAEIEPGSRFAYMTFGGQVPGPMIRVRQGDRVKLTLENRSGNRRPHNVDFHAVYGTGGGSEATLVAPGASATVAFEASYPGAFIYHCAVPNLDHHISAGMFGMILVEPPDGLPPVDREFYLGQHELYTDRPTGEEGLHRIDREAMEREDPTYVLLNGERDGLTGGRRGPLEAATGETARIFFVNGGPNRPSHFHPIGNVWTKAWREGALASEPERYVQTVTVPPGSCGVFEMEFPVAETVRLVDHALTRVARKGMLGEIAVEGEDDPAIFDPEPTA